MKANWIWFYRYNQGCGVNFIGAGALLGIFACICRRRSIIHWYCRSGRVDLRQLWVLFFWVTPYCQRKSMIMQETGLLICGGVCTQARQTFSTPHRKKSVLILFSLLSTFFAKNRLMKKHFQLHHCV